MRCFCEESCANINAIPAASTFPQGASVTTSKDTRAILEDSDFKELARKKGSISTILTLLMMLAYFGFVFLLAFAPAVLSDDVGVLLWDSSGHRRYCYRLYPHRRLRALGQQHL
jgi:hypothetical protein